MGEERREGGRGTPADVTSGQPKRSDDDDEERRAKTRCLTSSESHDVAK